MNRISAVPDPFLRMCQLLREADSQPSLEELGRAIDRSPSQALRIFRARTGLSPKELYQELRAEKLRSLLGRGKSVTRASYEAGYGSLGRIAEHSRRALGMTPSEYRAGAPGEIIHFAVGECSLGTILVAQSRHGVCSISLGSDGEALLRDLERHFCKAELIGAHPGFEATVARVVGMVEKPSEPLDLPLDIRGTVFQRKVWATLSRIPPGETWTYTRLAEELGIPTAVRAVARACADNRLAVAIPCHRVVRKDGNLAGYRWGVERKRSLLAREQKLDAPHQT